MGREENKANQRGLERGREGCESSEGILDEIGNLLVKAMTFGLVEESDSVRRAREGGFEFGKSNPASQRIEDAPITNPYDEQEYTSCSDDYEDWEEDGDESVDWGDQTDASVIPESSIEHRPEPHWQTCEFVTDILGVRSSRSFTFYLDDWSRAEFKKRTQREVGDEISKNDAEILQKIDQGRKFEENPFYPFSKLLEKFGVEPGTPAADEMLKSYRVMLGPPLP